MYVSFLESYSPVYYYLGKDVIKVTSSHSNYGFSLYSLSSCLSLLSTNMRFMLIMDIMSIQMFLSFSSPPSPFTTLTYNERLIILRESKERNNSYLAISYHHSVTSSSSPPFIDYTSDFAKSQALKHSGTGQTSFILTC